MENEKLSILAAYDDLRRCGAILTDGMIEKEFLRFATNQNQNRIQWLRAVDEAQRIQRELDATLQNVAGLETKLYHARRLLEAETKKRKEAERERDLLDKKIHQAHDLLYQANINEETRTKFAFLGEDERRQKRRSRRHSDAYGNEINSTGSILSELSVTQSEDDFLEEVNMRPLRKHKPAKGLDPNTSFIGSKRTRASLDAKRNSTSKPSQSQTLEVGASDKIVASTRVSIPKGNGPITAESTIEAVPDSNIRSPKSTPLKKRRSSTTLKRTFSPTAPTLHEVDDEIMPDICQSSVPPSSQSKFPNQACSQIYTPASPSSNTPSSGQHSFASRTFLKSDICVHCQKKIKFGTNSLKCRNCRIMVHNDCEPRLNMICMPASTNGPTTPKGQLGQLSDYAPSQSPMVPAIIVHCINEIEARGLTEVGIYRVSGSEKEIKSLKDRFLRGKTVPTLHNIDVHVLCGCIKDFLRTLREPLIPTGLWSEFSNASQNACETTGMREIYKALGNLPPANRDTLAFLMQHFLRVAKATEIKMPISNLAKVFGPTIVGYSSANPGEHAIFTETIIQASVMEKLLSIPSDYWNRYLSVVSSRYADADGSQFFGTPSRSGRKQKFFSTPPYTTLRKK